MSDSCAILSDPYPAPVLPRRPGARPFQVVDGSAALPADLAGSVMLLGNFDGFHNGHRALLARAQTLARTAPLSVMSVEPHPRQLFSPGTAPFRLSSARTKQALFAQAGLAFAFTPRFDHAFAGQSAEGFVADVLAGLLKVAHVVVGEGFRFGCQRRGTVELLCAMGRELGFGVTAVAPVRHQDLVCSSTLVRDLLRQGDIAGANALLGAPWTVEVRTAAVQEGALVLDWPDEVLRPASGAYAARLGDPAGLAPVTGSVLVGAGRMLFRPDRPFARPASSFLALELTDRS